MNRKLMMGLGAVLAATLYLSTQSDDELVAPGKDGAPRAQGRGPKAAMASQDDAAPARADGEPARLGERASKLATPQADLEPWVAQALRSGVAQWQGRQANGQAPWSGHNALLAWGSNSPPPPSLPSVAHAEAPPPPPPVAPRFPHAWVGRFNDEPVATAASGVSRAVLSGPQTTWVVRAGDVIEGQWRIDRIQDRTLSLTYLPLQQQQTLTMK